MKRARISIVLSLLITFLSVSYSQDRKSLEETTAQQEKTVAVNSNYDRFKDLTFTYTNFLSLGTKSVLGILFFDASAVSQGEKPNNNVASVFLTFYSARLARTPYSFEPSNTVYYIADGERGKIAADYSLIQCPESEELLAIRHKTCDSVSAQLSIEQFTKIVNAKKVEWQWGNAEFQMESETIEALRELLHRIQPANAQKK